MTPLHDWFVGLVAIAVGLLACAAAAFNWDWYFQMKKAQFVEHRVGRSGVRIASLLLGFALIALGVGIATDSIPRWHSGKRSRPGAQSRGDELSRLDRP